MNRDMMLKVADAIEAEQIGDFPIGFDMKTWGSSDAKHTCGTVACVAGYVSAIDVLEKKARTDKGKMKDAILRRARSNKRSFNSFFGHVPSPFAVGKEKLGLEAGDAEALFIPPDMGFINANVHLVPDALRWMALTGRISWPRAIAAAHCVRNQR